MVTTIKQKKKNLYLSKINNNNQKEKTYVVDLRRPLGDVLSLQVSSSATNWRSATGGVEGWACEGWVKSDWTLSGLDGGGWSVLSRLASGGWYWITSSVPGISSGDETWIQFSWFSLGWDLLLLLNCGLLWEWSIEFCVVMILRNSEPT